MKPDKWMEVAMKRDGEKRKRGIGQWKIRNEGRGGQIVCWLVT